MLEFEELAFKQAVTYCSNELTTIPLKDQGAVYVGGVNGAGKAQPLYSKIKIPSGWKTMGDIKVGDVISTPDGKEANVTHVFPQGMRPTYRMTLEDGRVVDCDENHLWKIYCRNWARKSRNNHKEYFKVENPERVMSLKEIIEYKQRIKADLFIPLTLPTETATKELPLDPYVLGLLLGDGGLTRSITFTNVDSENVVNLQERLKEGYYLKVTSKKKKYCYRITPIPEYRQGKKGHFGVFNYYVKVLKDLNLHGKHSHEKFVPEIYKECSIEQRLELLRGLMDTDGEVSSGKPVKIKYKNRHVGGDVSYSTSSHQLATDVQYLVRSLGGLCKIRIKKSHYKTKEGVRKRCRTRFKCCIRHSDPEILIRLSRKSERAIRSLPVTLRCKIKSIKYLGMQQTQCIMIDHPDHLYITDGFSVTHNSLPWNVLYNVLFGYTPLSSKGKRKLIANPDYYARVKFNIDNIPYEIRQFFDNPDFEYEGYDILKNGVSLKISGGIPEAEKYISRLLPFTPEEFNSFYYLSQDSLHVLAYGKGSERLDYLSKVFGFDIYDQIRAKLKVKLDEVDVQLADVCRAQENADKLEEHLKKYPSQELLEKRIEICSFYLDSSKREREKLQSLKSDIENKTTIYHTRENIENTIEKYGALRELSIISSDIQNWQKKQSEYQVYLNQCMLKKKLLQEFSLVKDYLEYDTRGLNEQFSSLMEQRGKAVLLNERLKQKREVISKVDNLSLELKHKSVEIPQRAKEISDSLVEKGALLKQKERAISDFTNLSKDGKVCTRCGQVLDSEHIEKELSKLSSEVSELKLLIRSLKESDAIYQREMKILAEIAKYQKVLESIQCAIETEIDIVILDNEIENIRKKLNNAKEAQRLKKELSTYTKYDESKIKAITEQLPKLRDRLGKLQEEFGKSREKESLIVQLNKLPMISKIDIADFKLKKIVEELLIYDEIIPMIASDIREFTTIKNTVSDYEQQIAKELEKVKALNKLNAFRRVVNACYKAYLPSNLKKIQVSKVAEAIAQKLNIFVPLIFNEDISFTVNADENSVDILFKRGEQPARDVKFLNGGFKKRFLITLIPTLAGLISVRKRTNLIILDEIEANVDASGREAIGEFLIPFLKTKFKTVIVISPSNVTSDGHLEASIPLDNFDRIWLASYAEGTSRFDLSGRK